MKLSLNWLKDYITLSETPQQLAEYITLHIAEVEGFEDQIEKFKHIVVGEVLEARKHPDADNLNIGKFDVGEASPRQIVFGGKAILHVGNKLPISLPGAQIGPITIVKRKLRGEVSEGMCCLNSELEILDNGDQVHLFDASIKNGTPISEALGLNDVIFEIENKTLTHRPDLFSHIGFARELSVVLQRSFKEPILESPVIESGNTPTLSIEVKDQNLCPRYMAVLLENVGIVESPQWMQQRLTAVGVKSINLIVDTTNYVMLEYGQPLHAFDANKIKDHHIIVRQAQANEMLTTLDGVDRTLTESMLVIADHIKPIALAGIMGGNNSEIDTTTTDIILESALFNEVSVRKTAQQLGIRTEASTRFEKGPGYVSPRLGLLRAIQLLQKHANAKLSSHIADNTITPSKPEIIKVSLEHISRLIGVEITQSEIKRILTGLGCTVEGSDILHVTTPGWRTDLHHDQDIIEEIARMYGYDSIPPQPLIGSIEPPANETLFRAADELVKKCVQFGASEVQNYSFYSQETLQKCNLAEIEHLRMLNPMNPDQELLRQSLLPNLLHTVTLNQYQYPEFTMVEYGHVYTKETETQLISLVSFGKTPEVLFILKGYIERLCSDYALNIKLLFNNTDTSSDQVSFEFSTLFDANSNSSYENSKKSLAVTGIIKSAITEQFNITGYVAAATLYLPLFSKYTEDYPKYSPINQYPNIDIDISIEVPLTVHWEAIKKAIYNEAKPLLQNITLFDLYTGDKVTTGHKALGIRMYFAAADRTLEMPEIEALRSKIITTLEKTFSAKHRY